MKLFPACFAVGLLPSLCQGLDGGVAAQTLRIGLQEDPDTLDAARNWSFVGRQIFASLCDKLVDIAPDQSFVPMIATAWSTAADGRSMVLKLRAGMRFHDGEPVDAAAVKYSLERALTLPDSRRKTEISAISRIEVIDPATVQLELAMP